MHLVPLQLFTCDHFRPQIQVPSAIPSVSHTKQNYVIIYPYVHTRQLSGGGGGGGLGFGGVVMADICRGLEVRLMLNVVTAG